MPTTTNKAIRLPAIGEAAWGSILNSQTFVDIDNIFNASGRVKPSDGGTGLDTSASSGVPSINAGTWSINNVLTANRILYGAASNIIASSANLTYDGTSFAIGTVGPHAVGGGISSNVQIAIGGSFTGTGGVTTSVRVASTITPPDNTNAYGVSIEPTLVETGAGTHNIFAGLRIAALQITAGLASLTNAASLYIDGAPTGATNNYALWVDAGDARFDGRIIWANDTYLAWNNTSGVVTNIAKYNASNNFQIDPLVGINVNPGSQLHVVSGAAGRVGLIVDTAASPTAKVQQWLMNGAEFAYMNASSSVSEMIIPARNLGNNVAGPGIQVDRNSNAGAEGPAAGIISVVQAGGGGAFLWSDNTAAPGVLRINTVRPTGSSGSPTVSDTAGTVVGSQTSWWELKENIVSARASDYENALQAVLAAPLYNFNLKSDSRRRLGYVIYEQDRGGWISYNDNPQQVPALDERNLFGYQSAAIKALYTRIITLESEINALRVQLN